MQLTHLRPQKSNGAFTLAPAESRLGDPVVSSLLLLQQTYSANVKDT